MEVGNDKMDAAARSEAKPCAPESAPVDMPLQQLLATLDQLMVMEASWHAGNALAQTVFTSLHMLNVERWVNSSGTLVKRILLTPLFALPCSQGIALLRALSKLYISRTLSRVYTQASSIQGL